MVLSSERCYLREWTSKDAEFLFKLNSDPDVLKYTGDMPFASVETAYEFIRNYNHYAEHGYGRWLVCLKTTDAVVGWCGLRNHEGLVDIGFRFLKEHWGKGLATETAKACIEFGFDTCGLDQIIARVAVNNKDSIRVIDKLGMRFWKTDLCHGHEANYYRLLKV